MRVLRVVVIVGVVLAALFTGADRWAAGYAENRLAERIQARQGLAGTAEVEIHGFPFLTQALSHDLDRVDLDLRGVEVMADGRKTRLAELDASFRGVKLNGDYSGGTAERATGSALITYADLTAASQTGATLSYGGAPGKVKVTASVDIVGRTLSRSVISTITLVDAPDSKGGKIVRVHAEEVPGEGIPGLERQVRKRTDFDRDLGTGLPAGLQLSALTSDESGVHLTLGGSNVVMAGS
ncbi:LmeA family phospholipid-binding protein [Streptomyces virginiae]|uniref:LmeA family phospholipid-binding protein n=1 Tax=Streptomyces virginiae TaxID=1961 RepID=UPI0034536B95